MTKKPELPWELEETVHFYPHPDTPGALSGSWTRGYADKVKIPIEHAQAFAKLVRRVIDKDAFMEFAKKCQEEIFNGEGK